LISFYEEIGLRLLVFCSHSQFAQNGLAQKRLDKYFQQPVELLNNFIPTHFFESQSRSQLVSKVRKVLFVGRFVEDKGIRELFDLFESTQRRYLGNQIEFDITITFIGDGPLLPWAKKQSSNYNLNCRFLGALSRPEVLDEMRTHDLLVQYPRSEGQPLVLLEAISMGLPIFTTPVDDCLNSLDSVYVAKEEDFKDEFYKILQNGIGTHSDHLKEIRHLKEHHSIELYCRKIIELGLK
jgi:glycosyltransferase involved in cell wall biosynthesis